MNKEEITRYINLCKQAGVPNSVIVNTLIKKSGLDKEANIVVNILKTVGKKGISGAKGAWNWLAGSNTLKKEVLESLKNKPLDEALKEITRLKAFKMYRPQEYAKLYGSSRLKDVAGAVGKGVSTVAKNKKVQLATGVGVTGYVGNSFLEDRIANSENNKDKMNGTKPSSPSSDVGILNSIMATLDKNPELVGAGIGAPIGAVATPYILSDMNPVNAAILGGVGGGVLGGLAGHYINNRSNLNAN